VIQARQSFRQTGQESFDTLPGALDFLCKLTAVALGGDQLTAQICVLVAQPLAERDELRDLLFQGVELSMHPGTILQIPRCVKR
jgi:hypothetical protein